MNSLRYRLLFSIFLVIGIFWLLIAPWLFFTIKDNVNQVLDDRLAASANMLATVMLEYDLNNIERETKSERLKQYTQTPVFPESIACRVTGVDGSLIVSSGNSGGDTLASAQDGYSLIDAGDMVWRVFQLTLNGFTVTTAEKIDKREQLLNLIWIGVVVPLVVAIVMMLVTSFIIINQFFKPLTNLQRQFAERSGNSLSPIEMPKIPIELKGVITEFNYLLERVQRVIDNERRFTADAAHELRTPLAGISTQLQVAILKADHVTDDSLKKAEIALKQLSQMLDQLLMLARLDANQIAAVSSPTDALSITEKALAPLRTLAKEKQIEVITKIYSDKTLTLPEELVTLALRNVIKNAIYFSSTGQIVTIIVNDSEMIVWQIEDNAGGVSDDILPVITERFVHDKRKGNSGLGLSITDSIIKILNGELLFENTSRGLRVTLSFPYSP